MNDCRKCVYLSMQDAKKAADTSGGRLRPYSCPTCGKFHLTSWTRSEWKRELKLRRKAIKQRKNNANN